MAVLPTAHFSPVAANLLFGKSQKSFSVWRYRRNRVLYFYPSLDFELGPRTSSISGIAIQSFLFWQLLFFEWLLLVFFSFVFTLLFLLGASCWFSISWSKSPSNNSFSFLNRSALIFSIWIWRNLERYIWLMVALFWAMIAFKSSMLCISESSLAATFSLVVLHLWVYVWGIAVAQPLRMFGRPTEFPGTRRKAQPVRFLPDFEYTQYCF